LPTDEAALPVIHLAVDEGELQVATEQGLALFGQPAFDGSH
jgi:hypothetical protein